MISQRKINVSRHLPSLWFVAGAAIVLSALVAIGVYAGAYNIAADAPHAKPVYWLINAIRNRSIAARAGNIALPADLNSEKRIAAGAGLYAEMCTGCHLAPGMEATELSQGLYPKAPQLSQPSRRSPAQKFWIIKHGVKLTAMPAWGKTHDDELIWDMVAFVDKLPSLSSSQYEAIVASAPEDHDEMMNEMKHRRGHDDGRSD